MPRRHYQIRVDDLRGPEIADLLQFHLDSVKDYSPAESIHALDLERLRAPEITFWTAWEDHQLAGCCALREIDATHGELKSMRTAPPYLRQGVASALLQVTLDAATRRGYRRLSLETGSHPNFEPARALYQRFGFRFCAPFDRYLSDPFSVFMTLELPPGVPQPPDGITPESDPWT